MSCVPSVVRLPCLMNLSASSSTWPMRNSTSRARLSATSLPSVATPTDSATSVMFSGFQTDIFAAEHGVRFGERGGSGGLCDGRRWSGVATRLGMRLGREARPGSLHEAGWMPVRLLQLADAWWKLRFGDKSRRWRCWTLSSSELRCSNAQKRQDFRTSCALHSQVHDRHCCPDAMFRLL